MLTERIQRLLNIVFPYQYDDSIIQSDKYIQRRKLQKTYYPDWDALAEFDPQTKPKVWQRMTPQEVQRFSSVSLSPRVLFLRVSTMWTMQYLKNLLKYCYGGSTYK